MEITFLGTSSGMPTKQRNVTAIALACTQTKAWYLIDCGEGTQHRLLHTRLSLHQLEAIFITHIHGDHCYGLPGLLATAGTRGRQAPLTLVGPAAVRQFVEAVCATTSLHLPYAINFVAVEDLPDNFTTSRFSVRRIGLSHRVPSWAYEFTEADLPPKLDQDKLKAVGLAPGPAWGDLQRGVDVTLTTGETLRARDCWQPAGRTRRIIIAGDNDRPELLENYTHELDLLVHEATYTDEVAQQVEPGPQHSSAKQVAAFADQHQLPNLILTHFSQRYHNGNPDAPSLELVRNEAANHYQGVLYLANDLEVYELNRDRQLRLKTARHSADASSTSL